METALAALVTGSSALSLAAFAAGAGALGGAIALTALRLAGHGRAPKAAASGSASRAGARAAAGGPPPPAHAAMAFPSFGGGSPSPAQPKRPAPGPPSSDATLFRIVDTQLISDSEPPLALRRALDLGPDSLRDLSDLAAAFPDGGAALADAAAGLERTGAEFSLLLRSADGTTWAAVGAPSGGEAWLSIASADPSHMALKTATETARSGELAAATATATLDAAPVLMWRRDIDGRLVWANARYRAFAGCEGDAPLRELEFGAAGATRPGIDNQDDARGSGPAPDGRLALFHATTGQRRWHEVSRVAIQDGGWLCFALDAGAAVMAESALRRFVETLTETFAHLRIGLAIFDHSRRLGLFNPAFAEMMHLDPAWLAGRPRLEDVLVRLRESRMMPDRADFTAWRAELLRLFESPDAADYAETWQLPGDVMTRVLARPHPQGSLAFLFEDVSETARLERRFATEVEIRRAVIDRLEEGVAAFGPDGAAQFANPAFARIWGFRPGALNAPAALGAVIRRCRPMTATPGGRPPAEGAMDAPQDIWSRLLAFASEGARRTAFSERLRLLDGRVLRARITTLPDGSILTAFTDVTDTERAAAALVERNAALEAADEIRNALVEQTSRSLRTPLNVIGGHAQALQDQDLDADQTARARAIMQRAREVHEAIDGMADLANAQAGAIALHQGEVDLRAAVESIRGRISRTASERGVTLEVTIDERIDAIPGDETRMRQILVNLITDAVQRAPVGAIVRAGLRPVEPEPSVDDAVAEMVEIWTSEPQQDHEPRRGLAHALARRLAELHGGHMRIVATPGMPGDIVARMQVICALPAGRMGAGPGGATSDGAGEAGAGEAGLSVLAAAPDPATPGNGATTAAAPRPVGDRPEGSSPKPAPVAMRKP
ncbi:MAG: signal transduction histidine kinase [Paracoccaceae bacterium]|jgi:signal transduction histidine kinase